MELFADAISAFGRRLGIEALTPGAGGAVDLSIEQVGRLQIEEREGVVLVTLARAWPRHGDKTARTALDLCHWRENHPWVVNAGAKGDEWLTFTARVAVNAFDVPTLEKMVGYLSGLMDAVERAG